MPEIQDSTVKFEPFCGLHYTSYTDQKKYADNLDSIEDNSFILNTYINYFTNLCCSMFRVKGLPDDIDNEFVIRTLISDGSIVFCKPTKRIKDSKTGEIKEVKYNLVAQPFKTNNKYNYYGRPTSVVLYSRGNCDTIFNGVTINDPNDFEIVKLNPQAVSLYPTIYYFCDKITRVQRAIDVNVYNNQTPLVIECVPDQMTTVAKAILQWGKQLKHIILNKSTGVRKEDLFSAREIGVEWKADRMTDVMQYYKAEFYTMLGINHTPYEKRANMVRDEVRSNSHILRLTVDSMLNSLNDGARLVNEKFGTNIVFEYALDSIYDTDIISTVDAEETAGLIDETEAEEKKLKEAYVKSLISEGSKIDDYMFGKHEQGTSLGHTDGGDRD